MENELGIPQELLDRVLEIANRQLPTVTEDLPERARQILEVQTHTLISASWQSSSGGQTDAQNVVILRGTPSPSSHPDLRQAYVIILRNEDSVPPPRYIQDRGAIYLWLRERQLPALLAQVRERSVYCWIGHFPGGHLYADVHTSP